MSSQAIPEVDECIQCGIVPAYSMPFDKGWTLRSAGWVCPSCGPDDGCVRTIPAPEVATHLRGYPNQCPSCPNQGWYQQGNMIDDAEIVPCEWCHETPDSIYNSVRKDALAEVAALAREIDKSFHEYRSSVDGVWKARMATDIRRDIAALLELAGQT